MMADAHSPEPEIDLNSDISYDKIANKLIRDGFLLTALELHAELIESGKEIPRLRDFFSNPGNFEKPNEEYDATPLSPSDVLTCVLPRTSSVQTFDSLDFARNSDDGDRQMDERIAVLEFELRKARETIKSLRASLTVSSASESASNFLVNPIISETCEESNDFDECLILKPHEKRALNFLINEYLMRHNYKLTSITFCDENEDQDFENWDDVGLNISKPDLLHIYRYYWWQHSRKSHQL